MLLVLWTLAPTGHAEKWPSRRGPTGQGVSAEKDVPGEWDETQNMRWKVALPDAGNSTPIVWGDCVLISNRHTQPTRFAPPPR